jgi:hypothetical protein
MSARPNKGMKLSDVGRMDRVATLTYQTTDGQATLLAEVRLQAGGTAHAVASAAHTFEVPGLGAFLLECSCVEANGNLSVALSRVALSREQLFLGMCAWREVDPYFGLALSSARYLHVYFRREK